jgi:chromosome segregation ATPase
VDKQEVVMAKDKLKKLENELQSARRQSTTESGKSFGGTIIEKKSAHERKKAEIMRLKIQVTKLQEEIAKHEMEEKQMASSLVETEKQVAAHTKLMGDVAGTIHKLESEIAVVKNVLSKQELFLNHTMAEKQYNEKTMAAKKASLVDLELRKKRDSEALEHLKQENHLIEHEVRLLEQKAR